MKRWRGHEHTLHWYWMRTASDVIACRRLENDDDLLTWCYQHACTVHRDHVVCPNSQIYLLFALRWNSQ